jgi:hypothetical protein
VSAMGFQVADSARRAVDLRGLAPEWTLRRSIQCNHVDQVPCSHMVRAMHPRRAAWLESLTDLQGRPLVVPGAQSPVNVMGIDPATSYGTGGTLLGLNVVTDANLPTAVGSGPGDQVLVYRAQDLILWEDGDGMPQQLRFEQTLGNQLTIKLVAFGYCAFTAGRYPSAVGVVGGNSAAGFGLVAPTF